MPLNIAKSLSTVYIKRPHKAPNPAPIKRDRKSCIGPKQLFDQFQNKSNNIITGKNTRVG